MNSILIYKAFNKAKKKVDTKVTTRASKYLSDFIFEDTGEQYGERVLRNKYNKIKDDKTEKIELRNYVQEALSHFLGYESFEDYITKYRTNEENDNYEEEGVIYHPEINNGKSTITILPKNKKWFVWFSNITVTNRNSLILAISTLSTLMSSFIVGNSQNV